MDWRLRAGRGVAANGAWRAQSSPVREALRVVRALTRRSYKSPSEQRLAARLAQACLPACLMASTIHVDECYPGRLLTAGLRAIVRRPITQPTWRQPD